MKLKRIVIISFSCLLVFLFASTVFANAISKKIDVTYGIIKKIIIDGVDKTPAADKMPFVFEGTTYVPLRYISDALGKGVNYQGGVISIGENHNGITFLTDSKPYMTDKIHAYKINNSNENGMYLSGSYYYEKSFVMKSGGKEYSKGITVTANSSEVSKLYYNLDGKFNELSGLVAFDENYRTDYIDKSYIVKFYVDDNLIHEVTIIKGELPTPIKFTLNKGLQLRVEFIRPSDDNSNNPNISLLEMKLSK